MHAIQPASGVAMVEHPDHSAGEIEARLARAEQAFAPWRDSGFGARARVLDAVGRALRAERAGLARLMTDEMGKPITQSEAEVDKCATTCEWFARHAESLLAAEEVRTEAAHSRVEYVPLGVILAVMPWNFPLWQAIRCAAPTLMAGNVVVLKHAANVPGCAVAIERLFSESGAAPGVFTTLLVGSQSVATLLDDPRIHGVSLTGSEAAGMAVAERAGRALKKAVLELGGSDPFIVLDDADPEWAAGHAAAARTINSGQSCIAAKRFVVAEPIADAFERAFVARMAALRVGDPMERTTDIGPLARADLRDQLDEQVRRAVSAGAVVALGGHPLEGAGWFYAATVLTGVGPGNPAFDEETFGPVAAVTRVRDDDEAVRIANTSRFGLGASVWSGDRARGERVARRLEAGNVFVNAMVRSDPRLPFGGIKRSGYGRELGALGIREFVNARTLWIA